MWFTNANSIGRINTAGTITNTTDPGITTPNGITTGPDGAVWFTTSADNSIGRISLPGPTRSKPSAPRATTAVPFGNGTAKISWQPPASSGGSPILGYVVTPYVSGLAQPSRLFNLHANTALVTGLTNRTQYRFTVAASNAIGRSAATPKTAAIVAGAPGPPSKPKAVKVAPGSLKVTFTPPATHGVAISSYSATCTSSNHGVTKTQSAAASPITVHGLTPGKTYTCTAAARNSVGIGPSSPPSAALNA